MTRELYINHRKSMPARKVKSRRPAFLGTTNRAARRAQAAIARRQRSKEPRP